MQQLPNFMPQRIVERVLSAAGHVIMNEGSESTIRAAAEFVDASTSTVYSDLSVRLPAINQLIFKQVRLKMEQNKSERHLRGGETIRKRYALSENEKLYKEIVKFTTEKYSKVSYFGECSYEEHVRLVCKMLDEMGYSIEYSIIARLMGLMEYCKFEFNILNKLYGSDIASIVNRLVRKYNQNILRYLRRIQLNNICLIVKLVDILGRMEKMIILIDSGIRLPEAKEYFLEIITYYHSMFKSSVLSEKYTKLMIALMKRYNMLSLENEILRYLAAKFNFSCTVVNQNTIDVSSRYDKWKISWIDGGTLRLNHKSILSKHRGNKGFHIQHDFKAERQDASMAHVFQWIKNHDVYKEQIFQESL